MCIDLPNGKQASKINYIELIRKEPVHEESGAGATDFADIEKLQG